MYPHSTELSSEWDRMMYAASFSPSYVCRCRKD